MKQGESEAFRQLYDRHYVVLCRLANAWLHDPFLAETVVGDTLVHLYEIREQLSINTSLRSYLVRAVRNRCLNWLQQEIARHETDLEEVPLDLAEADEHGPLETLLEQELEQQIEAAINRLSEETRTVFRKSRFEHKKNEEIAAELGISVNTVKYHIKRALASLQQDLGKYLLFLLFLNK